MSRGARQFESSDQLPASDGVTVNETTSDVRVAIVTTIPNSARKRPVIPGRNAIGKKTTTSTSVMTIAAPPISLLPRRRRARRFAALEVTFDVFEYDDRVVDQNPDDERHRQERDGVDVKPPSFIAKSVTKSDVGIATITTSELRQSARRRASRRR